MASPGWNVPNAADATHPRQAGIYNTDVDALAAGFARTAVLEGCEVTVATGMDVDVASGVVSLEAVNQDAAADTLTVGAAHASLDRMDLVVANGSTGAVSIVAGTAASAETVVPPAVPADSILLAMVYVEASAASLASGDVIDKRVLLATPFEPGVPIGPTILEPVDQTPLTIGETVSVVLT